MPNAPPPLSLGIVHIDALAAALAKLGIQVPIAEVIEAIREEEEKRGAELKRTAVLERELFAAIFFD